MIIFRLTTGLSGLLFIGIDIGRKNTFFEKFMLKNQISIQTGIAAFFLKKFGNNKKPSKYQRPPSGEERAFSPTHINVEEPDGRLSSRGHSTLSGIFFTFYEINSTLFYR